MLRNLVRTSGSCTTETQAFHRRCISDRGGRWKHAELTDAPGSRTCLSLICLRMQASVLGTTKRQESRRNHDAMYCQLFWLATLTSVPTKSFGKQACASSVRNNGDPDDGKGSWIRRWRAPCAPTRHSEKKTPLSNLSNGEVQVPTCSDGRKGALQVAW